MNCSVFSSWYSAPFPFPNNNNNNNRTEKQPVLHLREMVSGRLPFAGMSMEMYLAQVCDVSEP